MSSSSAVMLLCSVLLLHKTHCLSVGQVCNSLVPNECEPGLTCVADSSSGISYCQYANREPCDLAICPSVWCGPSLQYTPEDECCPVCPPQPTLHTPPPGCTDESGNHYNEGETWQSNTCTTCTCSGGYPLCSTVSCAPLSCTNHALIPGQCCPVCLETSAVFAPAPSGDCQVGDTVYRDGERWVPDITRPCRRAFCDEGEILYVSHQCAAPSCENPVYSEGTCCPSCPDDEPATTTTTQTIATDATTSQTSTTDDTVLECMYNDITLREGERYCPAPNQTVICQAGRLEYSSHCAPLTCADPIQGRHACDCPFCAEDAQHFQVDGQLDIPLHQFARNVRQIDEMIDGLVEDAGLYPEYNRYSQCNRKICVEMHVMTSDTSATDESVVNAVRNELDSKDHEGLVVGYPGEFATTNRRSVRSTDDTTDPDFLYISPDRRHGSATSTVIAVTAAMCGVVASVVGVALLATFVHRKQQTLHKTISA